MDKDIRYMEFIHARAELQSGDGIDDIVVPIYLPTSKTESYAMLIHKIQGCTSTPHLEKAEADYVLDAGLVYQPTPISLVPGSPNVIQAWGMVNRIVETALTVMAQLVSLCGNGGGGNGCDVNFSPPILIAADVIYLMYFRDPGSEWFVTADVRIGYTLERVSREAFIAALVR